MVKPFSNTPTNYRRLLLHSEVTSAFISYYNFNGWCRCLAPHCQASFTVNNTPYLHVDINRQISKLNTRQLL